MYKTILVPIDPGQTARHAQSLDMARALKADETAKIIALTVIEPVPGYFAMAGTLPELQVRAADQVLQELQRIVGDADDIEAHVMHGHPATEINAYAEQHGVDCIVIASHRPEFVDYFLGSTAARVVRHAPCSVHVIR